ncbi:MAG: TetR/AcrR family transcriptional regulator [Mangrovicoccus sp.]
MSKAQQKREKALEAAMQLFWRKGYHATSLKDLENALDMRPGSIYAAFKSKEDLFIAAMALYVQATTDKIGGIMQAATTPLAGLAEYVRAQVASACTDNPEPACMLAKTVLEMTDDDTKAGDAARDFLQGAEAYFAQAFEQAKLDGQLPADADAIRLARQYQAKVFGLNVFAQRCQDWDILRALSEDLAQEVENLGKAQAA